MPRLRVGLCPTFSMWECCQTPNLDGNEQIQTPGLGSLFRGDRPAVHVGQWRFLAPDLARFAFQEPTADLSLDPQSLLNRDFRLCRFLKRPNLIGDEGDLFVLNF